MRGASDVTGGLHGLFQILQRHAKSGVCRNELQKIVVQSLFLDTASCLHGQRADALVQFLTVAAGFDSIHHDVLSRHKGQFAAKALLDDLGINLEAVRNIQAEVEDAVHCKEAFGNGDPLVGRIVQCSLKPLGACCNGRIEDIRHDITGK